VPEGGARIGLVYPAVEIAAALLVAACVLAFGLTFYAAIAAFFCCVLVAISAIDIEHRIVPDRIVLPSTLIVLAAQMVRDPSSSGRSQRSSPRSSCSSPRSSTRPGWEWAT
jgi:Type II secretory pathway, prepilin signal peptidase PulO and related peptidases